MPKGFPSSIPNSGGSSLCFYGCNQPALFLIGKKLQPCCSSSLYSCPFIRQSKSPKVRKLILPSLCSYGCGNPSICMIGDKPSCSPNYSACPAINERRGVTNLVRYGTIYGNPEFGNTRKKYQLPSGRILNLQGYEPDVLGYLLSKYSESDFDFDNKPVIPYFDPISDKTRLYYPDFFIPKDNLIIEVKSVYTYIGMEEFEGVINLAKAKAAQTSGYSFNFIVWDKGAPVTGSDLWELNHRLGKQLFKKYPQKGYQRHIREIYEITTPHPVIELLNAQVRCISNEVAKSVILKYEWLQTMAPAIVASYGLYVGEELLGTVCFSRPAGGAKNILSDVQENEVLYLSRGACVHYAGRNAGSFLVSHACKMVSKELNCKAVFAYSDEEAGEAGVIYRACNWMYIGSNLGRKSQYHYDYISPDGSKVITSYQLNHDKNREIVKSLGWTSGKIRPFLRGINWKEVKRSGKGKWVWLAGSSFHKKKLLKRLVSPLPYPPLKIKTPSSLPSSLVPIEVLKRGVSKKLKQAWQRRIKRGDKFSFSTPISLGATSLLCAYGCGQPAVYLIGKTKIETPCCQPDYQLCPATLAKRRVVTPVKKPSTICVYGCGGLAKFLIGLKQKPCCETKNQMCPAQIASHRGLGGAKRGEHKVLHIPQGVSLVCPYGCGKQAVYFTNSKKKTPCCSPHPRSCSNYQNYLTTR